MITICENAKPYSVFQRSGKIEGVTFDVVPALKITYFKKKDYSC